MSISTYCPYCGSKYTSEAKKRKCPKCGRFLNYWQPVPVQNPVTNNDPDNDGDNDSLPDKD